MPKVPHKSLKQEGVEGRSADNQRQVVNAVRFGLMVCHTWQCAQRISPRDGGLREFKPGRGMLRRFRSIREKVSPRDGCSADRARAASSSTGRASPCPSA